MSNMPKDTAKYYTELLQYYINNEMQEEAIQIANYLADYLVDVDVKFSSLSTPQNVQPSNQAYYVRDQFGQEILIEAGPVINQALPGFIPGTVMHSYRELPQIAQSIPISNQMIPNKLPRVLPPLNHVQNMPNQLYQANIPYAYVLNNINK